MEITILDFIDLIGRINGAGAKLIAVYVYPSLKNHATLKFSDGSHVILPYSEIRDYFTSPHVTNKPKILKQAPTETQKTDSTVSPTPQRFSALILEKSILEIFRTFPFEAAAIYLLCSKFPKKLRQLSFLSNNQIWRINWGTRFIKIFYPEIENKIREILYQKLIKEPALKSTLLDENLEILDQFQEIPPDLLEEMEKAPSLSKWDEVTIFSNLTRIIDYEKFLTFNRIKFRVEEMKNIKIVTFKNPFSLGSRFHYLIELKDGKTYVITPNSVIKPKEAGCYYKDQDFSWSCLSDIYNIMIEKKCKRSNYRLAKTWAKLNGYPVKK